MEGNDYSRQVRPVYFDALLPYIVALTIGGLLIGIGMTLKIDGLYNAGTILDIICCIILFFEGMAVTHKHLTAINSERKRNGLPLIGKDAIVVAQVEQLQAQINALQNQINQSSAEPEPTPESRPSVDVWNAQGNHAERKHYDDPPQITFFETLFGTAQANGRIMSEPAFARWGRTTGHWTGTQSNAWLTYTDEQGVTEKMYEAENGNSPRRIKPGVTYDMALEKFGLTRPTLSRESVTPNAPSQA